MKSRVSPSPAATMPSGAAALSTVRALVVPTAHSRPPWSLASAITAAAVGGTEYHSSCMRVQRRVLRFDGLEGAGADMEDDIGPLDAPFGDAGEQLRGEVQASGRRGHRPRLASIHRLI